MCHHRNDINSQPLQSLGSRRVLDYYNTKTLPRAIETSIIQAEAVPEPRNTNRP